MTPNERGHYYSMHSPLAEFCGWMVVFEFKRSINDTQQRRCNATRSTRGASTSKITTETWFIISNALHLHPVRRARRLSPPPRCSRTPPPRIPRWEALRRARLGFQNMMLHSCALYIICLPNPLLQGASRTLRDSTCFFPVHLCLKHLSFRVQ